MRRLATGSEFTSTQMKLTENLWLVDVFPDEADILTVGVEQPRDPQLLLGQPEGLLQVLPVAPGSGFGQVHQVGPQRIQDGQEDDTAPPAGFEVLHI